MWRRGGMPVRLPTLILAVLLGGWSAAAQEPDTAAWTAHVGAEYRVINDVTYLTASNYQCRLDVYVPRGATTPLPTVMYFHGGGWVARSKEYMVLNILPYLEMGWNVVNVGYRLGNVANAPAAVEDGRCALRWVIRNAPQYLFDTSKIVVTGHSAGGHLALMTGMLPESAGLDRQCPGEEKLAVAAIVNWVGITDVADLLEGANQKSYAVEWLGSQPNREEVARRVSPLQYVRAGLPPVLSIHGDADPTVPYSHAVRLHQALERVGVPNQLLTVPGGGHWRFTAQQDARLIAEISGFLARHGLTRVRPGPR
ncbi:MAG: alpha/beta hydrolase [Acidobacteria bacterium]|nr:alpha/beta hydrolase [Acidobacteriota bacterium]